VPPGSGSLTTPLGACSRRFASVNAGPLWQLAQVPLVLKITRPRVAAAGSKLPAGGAGGGGGCSVSWYSCSAGNLPLTKSLVRS
jgi:hypothetical protein